MLICIIYYDPKNSGNIRGAKKNGVLTQKPHRLLLGDVDVEVTMATQQGRQHQQQHMTPHRPECVPVTDEDN
jgi:hypothetical protein